MSIHRLPAWSLPGELHYPFFRGLKRVLATSATGVVHAHTYGTNHAAAAARYARRAQRPFVLTAHYHPIWSIEGGWLRHPGFAGSTTGSSPRQSWRPRHG